MSHAINPDSDITNSNNEPTNNTGNQNSQPLTEMKTQEKMKIMAAQIKTKSKENAKKVAEKTKDRLSLEGQLKQARISLERFVNPKILNRPFREDTLIPKWVLKKAKGIVFLTVVKAGFLFAGNVGTGCVIVRKPNGGWTGPSSIAVAGVSFGFLAGVSKVDYLMILPDDAAVKQFTGNGQLRLGGELQVALGPLGREGSGSVGAGDKGLSVIFSYSHAQGLYGGIAFDGKIISVRPDCNDKYYSKKVTCFDILTGEIEPPLNEDYDMIVHLLDSYCNDDLTPMKGERISIDDLDNYDENDAKQNGNGKNGKIQAPKEKAPSPQYRTVDKNASEIMDDIGAKFQSGFNNLKSMLFNKNKTSNQASFDNSNNNNIPSNSNNNNNNNNNNDSNNNSNINDQMSSASNPQNFSISPQSNNSSQNEDDHRPAY